MFRLYKTFWQINLVCQNSLYIIKLELFSYIHIPCSTISSPVLFVGALICSIRSIEFSNGESLLKSVYIFNDRIIDSLLNSVMVKFYCIH
jgi:hypothetical protein